ncbi:hypothetical protein Ancab_039553 [Ancistrocladus abbreviatus]
MAGAVVSSVANWIGTQLNNEVGFLLGVEKQVQSLKRDLEYIALHLREADSGEEGDDDKLRIFTEEIRQIAFDAEDAVDNYTLKFGSSSSTNVCGNFLEKFLRILCRCSCLDIYFIGKETEAICKSANAAVERFKKFQNIAPGESSNQPRPHPGVMQTYPHTEDAYVVLRDNDVEDLVRQLTNHQEARVVAIVGAGGIGKTTLARIVYNDIRIEDHFKPTAWVTVSQQWDPKDLLFQILRQTKDISDEERKTIKSWEVQEFVSAIYRFLSEKPYLIVLDHMWETKAWVSIYPALAHRGSRSKVIITSRRELDLPLPVDDRRCFTHRPRLLNENESLELFNRIALEGRDPQSTVDDGAIRLGREMINRCDGLPLGVVTLAGLLRTKDASEWEDVSRTFKSIILNVQGPPQYGRSLYQTLTLSYYDLPHYLKPCFLHLASFPEDFEISAKMLARMWIAEGFAEYHRQYF